MSNSETATLQSTDVEMVTIPKAEYDALNDELMWLQCLEAAGVDNWEGIDFAHELFEDLNEETN